MKLINPFGPKIAVLKIPKNIIKKINNEFEQILLSKKLVKERDYSKKLVGQVRQEIELSNKFIEKNLTKGDKKIKTHGTIDFIYGSKSFLNNSIYNHIPKVGDLLLFPNYLMHTAYPFKIDGERRSFSFNLEIDKKVSSIFNE